MINVIKSQILNIERVLCPEVESVAPETILSECWSLILVPQWLPWCQHWHHQWHHWHDQLKSPAALWSHWGWQSPGTWSGSELCRGRVKSMIGLYKWLTSTGGAVCLDQVHCSSRLYVGNSVSHLLCDRCLLHHTQCCCCAPVSQVRSLALESRLQLFFSADIIVSRNPSTWLLWISVSLEWWWWAKFPSSSSTSITEDHTLECSALR